MIKYTTYRNSVSLHYGNSLMNLYLLPSEGGRIIQLSMGEYEYLYNNSDNSENNTGWKNRGGEKIWPAPQGWNGADQWPGPINSILDSGKYDLSEVSNDKYGEGIRLTSPYDEFTGIISSREIFLSQSSAVINISARFKNNSDTPRTWSIWPVCQVDTLQNEVLEEGRFTFYCPTNRNSKFPDGYKIMHGVVNNPQYRIGKTGNFTAAYNYMVGKVGLDSNGGWAASLDKKYGKVLCLSFDVVPGAIYPHDTSVQFWTSGVGVVYSGNRLKNHPDNKNQNPPYGEIEILSPLHKLKPGESAFFDYKISICTIPAGEEIYSISTIAVTARELSAQITNKKTIIKGKYGHFYNGYITVEANGDILLKQEVSPYSGSEISIITDQIISGKISVMAYDKENLFLGLIDKININ